MPIYMDRHDVSETVTAENVAQLHKADLKIQHQFDCRGLTYWFDEKRKTAFCLIEAPNAKAISAPVEGLSANGKLLVPAAAAEPLTVSGMALISGRRSLNSEISCASLAVPE